MFCARIICNNGNLERSLFESNIWYTVIILRWFHGFVNYVFGFTLVLDRHYLFFCSFSTECVGGFWIIFCCVRCSLFRDQLYEILMEFLLNILLSSVDLGKSLSRIFNRLLNFVFTDSYKGWLYNMLFLLMFLGLLLKFVRSFN